MWCHEIMWCHVRACDVMRGHVMSCEIMRDHVMSCEAMWCHLRSCDVMWDHVGLCDVMWDHVMSFEIMWDHVMWCHLRACEESKLPYHQGDQRDWGIQDPEREMFSKFNTQTTFSAKQLYSTHQVLTTRVGNTCISREQAHLNLRKTEKYKHMVCGRCPRWQIACWPSMSFWWPTNIFFQDMCHWLVLGGVSKLERDILYSNAEGSHLPLAVMYSWRTL